MRWRLEEKNKLKDLYLNTALTLGEVAKKLGKTPAALNNRLAKLKVNRRLTPIAKSPRSVTPALARIHAHVCGDGYMYKYKEKDDYGDFARYRKNKMRMRYITGYCNNNGGLIKEFQNDLYEVFGVNGKLGRKGDNLYVRINSKRIWVLLQKLGAGSSYDWRIPKEIRNGTREIMRSWIRAFFDDEAYFNDGGRIRVKCVNKKGLRQLTAMLSNMIPCHLSPKRGFYWGKTVCVSINKGDAPEFFKKIGSTRYKPKPA